MAGGTLRDKNMAFAMAVADRDADAVVASLKSGAQVHYNDDFALRSAAWLGYTDIAELLLKNGANVHANGDEPLFTAIKARDNVMIEMLLAKGASLQAVCDTKKGMLDRESLELISKIQSRDLHAASEKTRGGVEKESKENSPPDNKGERALICYHNQHMLLFTC